jgi:hypothetical protein
MEGGVALEEGGEEEEEEEEGGGGGGSGWGGRGRGAALAPPHPDTVKREWVIRVGGRAQALIGLGSAFAARSRRAASYLANMGPGATADLEDMFVGLRGGGARKGATATAVAAAAAAAEAKTVAARERGVIFDIGHGGGSFGFKTTRAMLAHGFLPDVISSDVHILSIDGPAFDLLTTMSKFLVLGVDLGFVQGDDDAFARFGDVIELDVHSEILRGNCDK